MSKVLDVYWSNKLVGRLVQDDHGDMSFSYEPSWLNEPTSLPLSCSLPLSEKRFHRRECQAFFQGILPEEANRRLIAKILGITPNNDFSLLEKIGGECAGAITFLKPSQERNYIENTYRPINEKELAEILRILPSRPLLAGENGVRLSLAGVQDKIAVSIIDGEMMLPLDGSPSTHIIKPSISSFEGVIYNELYCLELANKIGINTVTATVEKVAEIEYLLIERYDRKIIKSNSGESQIIRLHQEDFCQALNILSIKKYQNEGGPSLKQSFDLVRDYSSLPVIDLQQLLDVVIFNFLIGNCDAHGKNFSLILGAELRLAPFYDLISTTYYKELSKKMAMKMGGEYNISRIKMKHFSKLASQLGLRDSAVCKRVMEVANMVLENINPIKIENDVTRTIANNVKEQCIRLLKDHSL